jgi:crossover junction endodeoxyribonuclease RuvC
MAARVVGIDPSLTGTGVAAITAEGPLVQVISSKPTAAPSFMDRDNRLQLVADQVEQFVGDACELVVIEGPALGKASPHTWDRAGLWWRIVHQLHHLGVPLAVCPPTVRAKWATGKGNAGKAGVVAAIARMWPEVDLADDNAADALAFATIAAQRLDFPTVPMLARHRDALTSVDWPVSITGLTAVEAA